MARGLRETHELTDDELVDYLLSCRGTEPGWTRDGWPSCSPLESY